jgi:hypothetical protein
VIDLSTESVLSLKEAAKLLPPGRLGRPTSFACLWRWVLSGARAPDGGTVKLEALRLGGRWVTSRQALQRFAERLTPRVDDDPAPLPRSPARRQREDERAARKLDEIGI